MRRAVAATRQAISPRLAIRIFLNMRVSEDLLELERGRDARIGPAAEDARARGRTALRNCASSCGSATRSAPARATSSTTNTQRMRHGQPQPGGTTPSSTSEAPMLRERLGRGVDRRARGGLGGVAGRREPPPSSAATSAIAAWSAPNTPAASAAPAGMRITCAPCPTANRGRGSCRRRTRRSTMKPLAASTHRMLQQLQAARQRHPAEIAGQAGQEHHRYSRTPLAQPSAAASASSCGSVESASHGVMLGSASSQDGLRFAGRPARLRGLRRSRGCRRCACTVSATQRVVDRAAGHVRISALQARTAAGPAPTQRRRRSRRPWHRARRPRTTSCTKPMRMRLAPR